MIKLEIELTNSDAELLRQYYDTDQENPFPLNEIVEHIVNVRIADMLGFTPKRRTETGEWIDM